MAGVRESAESLKEHQAGVRSSTSIAPGDEGPLPPLPPEAGEAIRLQGRSALGTIPFDLEWVSAPTGVRVPGGKVPRHDPLVGDDVRQEALKLFRAEMETRRGGWGRSGAKPPADCCRAPQSWWTQLLPIRRRRLPSGMRGRRGITSPKTVPETNAVAGLELDPL